MYRIITAGSGSLNCGEMKSERAKIIGNVRIPGSAKDVVVDGNYAYVAAGPGGLRIIKLWQSYPL